MPQVNIITTLDGVTTAIVAFLLGCLAYPKLVKNRPQYYWALFFFIILVVVIHSLTLMFQRPGFAVFAGAITGFLQIGALLMLVLSVGGITPAQLAGDMARAYEVMRRGETTKEVIIPLSGQIPIPRERPDPTQGTYSIDTQALNPGQPVSAESHTDQIQP